MMRTATLLSGWIIAPPGRRKKINATGHPVLRYVGGKISPEMQTPKILWLKENRPHIYQQARHFFDLADYLTALNRR